MYRIALLLSLIITQPTRANSWGFFGHKTINHAAVFTLPAEMFAFYKANISQITTLAVQADKRRYISEDEAPRHYLDADFYESATPLDTIPRQYDSAIALFGIDTLIKHGIVPWHVIRVKWWLTKAFMAKDYTAIIKLSADLGHYVGDLHVPRHSTHNYNGQFTDQHGIHGFWESRLPELFSDNYDLFVGKATYLFDIENVVWDKFEESYAAVDSVLMFDKLTQQSIRDDLLYAYEQRGQQTVRTQSKTYSSAYHKALNNMVERRMRSSIWCVGSLWYTAWVDAGQPDLNLLTADTDLSIKDSFPIKGIFLGREEPN